MSKGFVYAICNICNIEGQFPVDLICPECGGRVDEMTLIAVSELAVLREKVAHDSEMLRADGEVLILALRYLGLDESGCDMQEIPEQIKRNRAELSSLRARVAELERKPLACPVCAGDGYVTNALDGKETCPACHGTLRARVAELEAQIAVVNVLAGCSGLGGGYCKLHGCWHVEETELSARAKNAHTQET